MRMDRFLPAGLTLCAVLTPFLHAPVFSSEQQWVTYPGGDGPGAGRKVVLIAGDEEYRSEEAMPMLGKVLSLRHGFECVALFSIDAETGAIDPEEQTNIPGLEALDAADLMVIATRFRELPDEQMKHIVDYVESGRPIVGLRTATHAFSYQRNPGSPYAHWSFRSETWPGGFGAAGARRHVDQPPRSPRSGEHTRRHRARRRRPPHPARSDRRLGPDGCLRGEEPR